MGTFIMVAIGGVAIFITGLTADEQSPAKKLGMVAGASLVGIGLFGTGAALVWNLIKAAAETVREVTYHASGGGSGGSGFVIPLIVLGIVAMSAIGGNGNHASGGSNIHTEKHVNKTVMKHTNVTAFSGNTKNIYKVTHNHYAGTSSNKVSSPKRSGPPVKVKRK